MGKRKLKFPTTLFVKRDRMDDENYYLLAYETIDGTVEVGETDEIAIYTLERIERVQGIVKREEETE